MCSNRVPEAGSSAGALECWSVGVGLSPGMSDLGVPE